MKNFAKLFQFETGQLLVMLNLNDVDDTPKLIIRTDGDGVTCERKGEYQSEESAVRDFENTDEAKALEIFTGIQKLISRS